MGTLVEETKKVDMEMPEKEEKEEKQTNSVSFEPQQQISPELSEGDTIQQKEGESFRMEPISFPVPYRVRRPRRLGEKTRHVVIERSIWDSSLEPIPIIPIHHRVRRPRTVQSDIPQPCEEELLEFEEDLREFIALRAARKKVQPNVVQTVRHPRTVQEDMLYKYLRVAKCYIEKYEHYASSYCPKSVSETDSIISSVSVKSDSSMYEPPSFNPQKIQSQLTEEISRCSVCEEAVKDPVPLPCGHRSCKQCVLSFRDQNGSAADYPCKKCGKRSETDQDLQSVLLEKKIKRVEMETEKFQAEKEKFLAEKEKLQAEKEKFLAEKEKLQPEKETFQPEKETFQAEKEKLKAEKETLQAEKKKLQAEKETFQAEKEKLQKEKEIFELEKRKSSHWSKRASTPTMIKVL